MFCFKRKPKKTNEQRIEEISDYDEIIEGKMYSVRQSRCIAYTIYTWDTSMHACSSWPATRYDGLYLTKNRNHFKYHYLKADDESAPMSQWISPISKNDAMREYQRHEQKVETFIESFGKSLVMA